LRGAQASACSAALSSSLDQLLSPASSLASAEPLGLEFHVPLESNRWIDRIKKGQLRSSSFEGMLYFLGGEANPNTQPHPSGRTNHPWGGRNHPRPLQRGFHWQKLRQRLVCRQVDGLQLHVWHFLTAWHPGHAKGVGLKK
jgi:hypothetical protein